MQCYVVVELKNKDFEPEFADKLNFYLTLIDKTMKRPNENPTIGILLCQGKDNLEVEYALQDIHKKCYRFDNNNKLLQFSLQNGNIFLMRQNIAFNIQFQPKEMSFVISTPPLTNGYTHYLNNSINYTKYLNSLFSLTFLFSHGKSLSVPDLKLLV